MNEQTGDPAPPPPPPPAPSFRLVRSRTDRKLAGVAGGLAVASGLDPTLVRMAVAAGALTGWGILLYLLAWVLIPDEDAAAGRPLVPASEETGRLLRIALAIFAGLGALQLAGLVVGAAFAVLGGLRVLLDPFIDPFAGDFGGFNPDFPARGLLGLILLVGGGAFLWRRRRGSALPTPPSGTATPPAPPAAPATSAGAPTIAPAPPAAAGAGAPPPTAPSGWRRAGDWLLLGTRATGWLVALWFAIAMAMVAAMWALGSIRLRFPFLLVVTSLAALGLLGTVLVRSRRPAVLAAAAAALLVPTVLTLALGRWNGAAGYRSVTPTSAAELAARYRHAAGMLRLDLSELRLPPGTTEVKVEMGAGEVEVTVPWDVTVDAAARIGVGEFNLFGRSQAGLSLQGQARSDGEPGSPTLEITSRASAGQIKVFRGSPPATKIALDRGQPVYLDCRADPAGLRCEPSDRFPSPQLDCLVSPELESICRPSGNPLPNDVVSWADQAGTRRCTVPPGGGLASCAEAPAPASEPPAAPETPPAPPAPPASPAPPPTMPPGTYLCEFPPGGGPATCRPA